MRIKPFIFHLSLATAAILAVAFPVLTSALPADAEQCLSFQSDLSYGSADAAFGGPILLLQQYLVSEGYMSATPTGYFGPATRAAVESFQSANAIPSSGYVGTLTRAALSRLTCGTADALQPSQASVASTGDPAPASIITSPSEGQVLGEGEPFEIQWSSQPYSRYDLVLVSSNGSNVGFIAQSIIGTSQYLWNVGSIFSSQSSSVQSVSAGSYQIRMQSSATGAEPSDPVSNPFTISPATLSISSVFPASAPADGSTAVVLYGSGFNGSVSLNLGSSGAKGSILYASPDGRVIVFSVPTTVLAGQQTVSLTNQSGQSSNQLSFTVMNP